MLVRFKKTGRITDTNAAKTFIKLGIAEAVEEKPKEVVTPVKKSTPAKSEVKKQPATKKRRGRPAQKK